MNGIFLLAKIYILASMFVGHVCYLPKLPFWQVCWLVVFVTCQNLILASMFVGRVCYLPKFDFGKYVRWSCLSVCLFVCLYGNFTKSQERLDQSSPNLVTSKH